MILAALALALGTLLGFAAGLRIARRRADNQARIAFERGRVYGADELSDEYIRAALDAPDIIERSWPVERRQSGRPS